MQKRGQAAKNAIVDAAADAFREEGYRAASMDAIAQKAGVSKATVYAHFESKDTLFQATVRRFVTPILKLLPGADPVEDVRAELIHFAETFSEILLTPEKADWDRMMVATSKQFPKLARSYFEAGPQKALNRLAKFLKAQEEAGNISVPDPEFSAEMFCGMLFGTRILRNLILSESPPTDPTRVHRSVDAFLKVHAK